MVTQFGMSERLGPISYDSSGHSIFIGRDFGMTRATREETAAIIDEEVKRIFDEANAACERILTEHADTLRGVAEYLLKNESMDGEEFSYFCHPRRPCRRKKAEPKMRDATIEPPARRISYTFDEPQTPPPATPPQSRGLRRGRVNEGQTAEGFFMRFPHGALINSTGKPPGIKTGGFWS